MIRFHLARFFEAPVLRVSSTHNVHGSNLHNPSTRSIARAGAVTTYETDKLASEFNICRDASFTVVFTASFPRPGSLLNHPSYSRAAALIWHHAWLRFQQLQSQCGPACKRGAFTEGYKHGNNDRGMHIRQWGRDRSRHESNIRAYSS